MPRTKTADKSKQQANRGLVARSGFINCIVKTQCSYTTVSRLAPGKKECQDWHHCDVTLQDGENVPRSSITACGHRLQPAKYNSDGHGDSACTVMCYLSKTKRPCA